MSDSPDNQQPDSSSAPARDGKSQPRPRNRRPEVVPDDPQSVRALEFLGEVVAQMEMSCRVRLRAPKEGDEQEIRLEITGEDAGRIIGKKGQVLGALQFLTNRVLNRPGEDRRYVNVDAEGYRSRRDDSLAAMAKRLGKQAMTDGKIITFEPMPPRDRRVVHLALAKLEGVVTRSDGEGDSRRVQIIPVRR
jgi:spoIIIJ-associated protein